MTGSDRNTTNKYTKPDHWIGVESALSSSDIENVESFLSNVALVEAGTYAASGAFDESKRKTKVGWIKPCEEVRWLYEKIYTIAHHANSKYWQFELSDVAGNIQYTVYDEHGSHFGWHMDLGIDEASTRKISVVVQLSDGTDYEGGDFYILNNIEPAKASRTKGSAVAFPSYLMHKVAPITKGVRKSLVAWVTGPPFR